MDLFNTKLSDRVLWYDGDTTLDGNAIEHLIACGNTTANIFVNEITKEINQYNNLMMDKNEKIKIKDKLNPLSFEWIIPDEYKTLNVEEYVVDKFLTTWAGEYSTDTVERTQRIAQELELYREFKLMDVLRTLIFIINTLIANNVVWGVGRGSSVASYVLYLIGVHDVDSFKYGLNIEEFLRTE